MTATAKTDPYSDGLSKEMRTEAERIVAEPFTSVERVARGYSRASYRATTADGRRFAIRVAPPDGPTTGTELDLVREAAFVRALTPTPVPVPHLYGVASGGSFFVTDWVAGRVGLGDLKPERRDEIHLRYIEALADLHRLDVSRLDVPGADAVADGATEGASRQLQLWRRVLEAKVRRPRPLAWFALDLLGRLPLPRAARLAVCHGDPGPANFLHDGARITALLDWEFAHVGDPVDDLAWWAIRGHALTGECGDLQTQLSHWSDATGIEVDDDSFRFYKALTGLRFYISLIIMLENTRGFVDRALPLRVLDRVGVLLPRLLAEAVGHPLPNYEVPPAPPAEVGGDAIEVVRTALADIALPDAKTSEARRRLSNTLPVVDLLERSLAAGQLVEAERAELTTLLGRPVNNVNEGNEALVGIVGDADREHALLEHFWRSGLRNNSLWPNQD